MKFMMMWMSLFLMMSGYVVEDDDVDDKDFKGFHFSDHENCSLIKFCLALQNSKLLTIFFCTLDTGSKLLLDQLST